MEHKKYWQSLGELKQTEAYEKSIQDEFAEDLIVTEDAKILDAKTPRRDFLKFLGFSTAAAMAAATTRWLRRLPSRRRPWSRPPSWGRS